MAIGGAVKTIIGDDTQAQAAARITAAGLPIDQPSLSKILRGKRPLNMEQAHIVEAAYGKPRGWIYARAGLIDVERLAAVLSELEPDRTRSAPARTSTLAASNAALRRAAKRAPRGAGQ